MKPKPPTLTPAQKALLAKRLRARGDKGEDLELAPLARDGRDGPFPLSSGQERLWFVDQYAPGTSTYNVPHGVRWRGPLDAGALERALHALVTRHEGLRARFVVEDGGPVQRIAPPDAWRLARADASDLAEATRLANAEAARPFDLSRDLLFRATLLRLGAEDHLLVLVVHHAVTDGWSIRILHRELITLYAAFAAGQPSPLAPLRLTYVDYAAWQRRLLASTHHDGELAYWKRALADAPTLELPTDHPRPPQQTFRGATHVLELPLATSRGLAALARAERVTLPIALLGTLAAVLARHTGQRDVVIGAPAANRTRLELEPLVGFFVNMLAIRIELGERPTTRSLFRITRDRMLEAQEHEKVPFDRVVEHVRPARDRSRHPVFQVAFRVNEPVDAPALPGVQLSSFAFELTVALYDLVLSIDVAGEHVRCTFDFNADLYDGATIERLAAHLGALLAAMIAEPDRDLDELSLAGPDDRDAPVTTPDGARGYVLDAAAHPCPIGVVGELYVEGPGGARVRTHTRARRRPDGGLDVLAAVTPSEPRRASAPAAVEPVAYVAPGDPTEVALAELWQTLLGVERVGVHDDFFALGGHSLLAARFVARLRALLGVELPVRALFDAPTIARIAATIAALRAERVAASAPPLTAAPRTARPPLSFAQRRLWFLHQLEPDGASYLVAHARRYDDLDVARLRGAFEALIARHEILRTSFPAVDGEPYQHVHAPAPFALPVDDARALAAGDREALLVRTAAAQRRPFDLAVAPPLRARLIQVGPTTHVLFVTLHHILTDGGSIDVFWRELWACYDGVAAPPLPVQYADFAAWQRAWLTGDELARQLAFWTERLRGAPEETELPFKGPRPPRQTYGGREHVVTLDDARTATLRDLARRHGATLFMALAAAFRALLVRYTGQLDVVLGTAIDNRSVAELDGLVGMFANTLALRNALSPDDTFATVLAREKAGALAALDHQHTPFELVVDALGVPRSLSRPPVFQVVYVHQGDAGAEERGAAQPTGQPPTAEFDLTLISWDHRDRLALHFLYNDDLFDGALIEQLGRHLVRLLDEVARAADRPLAALALLDDDERARLRAWGTASTPDEAPHVLELVARQVAAAPDAIAVEHAGTRLTYRALAERAERVAGWLAHRGVTRGDHVAICVERSADMVAALLGVLQVGAAYVPIDPEYPAARRELLRRDTGAVLELDDDALAAAVAWGAAGPHVAAGGDDVAYVIYTSGSTGTPKGVRVPHRSVANYLAAMRGPHGVTAASTVGAIASLSFDAHVIDLLLPLANGARCVIADRDTTRDGERLAALLDERGVDFMFATPSTWRALLATGWRPSRRFRVHAGGEAVPADLAATLLAHAESVWNGYGPTETTVYVSCTALAAGRPVTIGRPLAGLRAYVLDDARRMVPVGVAGELYVGGAGVALGYHARPALTAERFVVDAFAEHPGARMYRTGDRVRWTRDGQLEYLGRVDTQIKLRGLRIELGEIEAALRAMPDIDDVAVVLREDTPGAAQLVAYLATSAPLDDATIRGALRATLPDYMVPSAFVALPALPLNANGKLDRRALPLPDLAARAAYVAPRDAIETAIAATWRDILDVERVGAYDDFFALGGHSLLATRVTSRLRTELGVALPVRALFEAPTVADLAAHVAAARDAATPAPLALRPPPRAAHPPLSYAQQRLWFLQQLEPTSTAYVITRARRVPAVDVALLGRAFDEVRARHEILRTSFPAIGGAPYQRVHASAPWTITVEDARAEDAAAVLARVEAEHQRPFDLGAAPPLRTHLVRVAGDTDVLFVTLHHILTDGWSET